MKIKAIFAGLFLWLSALFGAPVKAADGNVDVNGAVKISSSDTSRNQTGYVEGMYWKGDYGVGGIVSHSEGHSIGSKSTWDINLIGAQVGVKGGSTFKTDDGRTEKSTWQVKGRLGVEHLESMNSKGFADKDQKTLLAGAYVEKLMTDGACLWGFTGSFWIPVGTRATGKVEDRTSVSADVRRECKIDDRWTWRAEAGPNWSAVSGTSVSIGGQLRYRTDFGATFFFGPEVSWSFVKNGLTIAGLVGVQFGGTDEGLLHQKYVKDHAITPTGRTGADVLAPTEKPAQVAVMTTVAVAPVARAKLPETDEEIRAALEVWWAEQKKKS